MKFSFAFNLAIALAYTVCAPATARDYAVLKLVQEGKMDLDAPIRNSSPKVTPTTILSTRRRNNSPCPANCVDIRSHSAALFKGDFGSGAL